MITKLEEIKLSDTTTSYEVQVELVPGKSFKDYFKDYLKVSKKLLEPIEKE